MKPRFLLLPASLAIAFSAPCSGLAQQRAVGAAENLEVIHGALQAQRQQFSAAMDQWREVRKQYLALRIDELKRVCDLSEKQVRKLEVAAKGAVEESLRQWRDILPPVGQEDEVAAVRQLQMHSLQMHMEALYELARRGGLDDPRAELILREVESFKLQLLAAPDPARRAAVNQVPAAAVQRGEGDDDAQKIVVFGGGDVRTVPAAHPVALNADAIRLWGFRAVPPASPDPSSVASEPLWKETVERTLTDEQKTAYHQAIEQRRSFQRKAAVEMVTAMIDGELLLSPAQREELTRLVDQFAGDQMAAVMSARATAVGELKTQMLRDLYLPRAKIRMILSDSQLVKWEELQTEVQAAARRGGRAASPDVRRVELGGFPAPGADP